MEIAEPKEISLWTFGIIVPFAQNKIQSLERSHIQFTLRFSVWDF